MHLFSKVVYRLKFLKVHINYLLKCKMIDAGGTRGNGWQILDWMMLCMIQEAVACSERILLPGLILHS